MPRSGECRLTRLMKIASRPDSIRDIPPPPQPSSQVAQALINQPTAPRHTPRPKATALLPLIGGAQTSERAAKRAVSCGVLNRPQCYNVPTYFAAERHISHRS
jgi:hypothetical protein